MNYLFIVMDDERRAHIEYLDSAQAVCNAVKRAVFDYRDGAEWLPEHIEEAAGITETLLEDGYFPFEGDPPLYLFQLPDGAANVAPAMSTKHPAPDAAASMVPSVSVTLRMGGDGNLHVMPTCRHVNARTTTGPTTDQINHWCPDCGANWTTWPERGNAGVESRKP